jgi:hypothetical protein
MFVAPNDINSAMLTPETMLENIDFFLGQHCNGTDLRSALRTALWHNSVLQCGDTKVKEPCAILTHWQGMDSIESYQKFMDDPVSRGMLEKNDWVGTTIDYHINSWGFRSANEYDYVPEPCIVALGCSFTFGTGLHEYQTWPSVLGRLLGVRVLNLGTPGHGLDLNSLWLTLEGDVVLNPIAVCVIEPPTGRLGWMVQYPYESNVYTHQLRQLEKNTDPRIIPNILLNSLVHSYKDYHAIKAWADRKSVPLLWNRNLMNPHIKSMARDLAHFGAKWHENKANDFYSHLKNT